MRLKRSPFVALLVLAIVVVGTGALYLYLVTHSNVFKSSVFKSITGNDLTKKSAEAVYPSILDGTMVSQDLSTRHPLGVMIENHPDARPQSGLSSASVVYEAIAEGGITRFLAIFGSGDASKVGPVRSARTYFVDWCEEFDCFYAHVGGNYDALYEKIPTDGVKDLDEFRFASTYHRELKANLATEHTMYTDTAKLYQLAEQQKWPTPIKNTYNIYSFLDDPATPTTTGIAPTIDFSTPQYKIAWQYVATTNQYNRNMAGTAHIDAANNQQIAAKNVIVQYINRTAVITKINESGWAMPTVGSGKADIYQGGAKISGTWKKESSYSRTQFFDASGTLIKLYRGPTWVEIVNPGSTVTEK